MITRLDIGIADFTIVDSILNKLNSFYGLVIQGDYSTILVVVLLVTFECSSGQCEGNVIVSSNLHGQLGSTFLIGTIRFVIFADTTSGCRGMIVVAH